MTSPTIDAPTVAIACGGTGGHLFPGLAVAGELLKLHCRVLVLISPKEIDQTAIQQARDVKVITLPAVGLTKGQAIAFTRGFFSSLRLSQRVLAAENIVAALAMGGFTSAPPLLAAKRLGAAIYLHESNTIPGRANRWLSWMADRAFVGFPDSLKRMRAATGQVTGTPVRPQFQPMDPREARARLGLALDLSTVLVTGGSQGASGLNHLVMSALPLLKLSLPRVQFLHLAGPNDVDKLRTAYKQNGIAATVHPFLAEMELALAATDLAISRAGASSLAELAAMRVPSILVPFPAAADNHQFHNAYAYERSGAALTCEQGKTDPLALVALIGRILTEPGAAQKMRQSLAQWHRPDAARQIAETIFHAASESAARRSHKVNHGTSGDSPQGLKTEAKSL